MSAALELQPIARRRLSLPLLGLLSGILVLACLLLALLGPVLAPHPPGQIVSPTVFAPPSRVFPLGTDYLGRDMLSRLLVGARYTVGTALPAALLASLLGTGLGMLAAVRGGLTDAVISRAMDTLISFPSLIFSLVIVAALGSSLAVLVGTAAVIYMPGCYRIIRAVAVDIETKDFVRAARARGERTSDIMRHEILPNIVTPVVTDFGLRFMFIVLLVSNLSFLGLGLQPPLSDWGGLVRENLSGLSVGAPAVILPAVAIAVLTVSVTLLVDNLPGRKAAMRER